MKQLLRLFASAYAPFPVLAWLGKVFLPYQLHPVQLPYEISFYDLRVFYAHTLPLLFVAAFLLQYLVVVPLWDKMIRGTKQHRQQALLIFLTVLIFTAGSLSYTVWDATAGIEALARSVITVLFVQIAYWLINITVLYLADVLYYKKQHISLTEL